MNWQSIFKLSASWTDYEDLRPVRDEPLLWMLPESHPTALLLTQKEAVFRRIAPELAKRSVAVCLVPYPTPSMHAREAIERVGRAFRAPMFWFGDLDPIGLMAFALLREPPRKPGRRTRRMKLSYIGIDDRWLSACRREQARVESRPLESQLILMGEQERQHLDFVVEAVPDLQGLVGARSFALLASGKKLEVEGLMTLSPRLLRVTPRLILSRIAGSKSPGR